MYCIYAVALAVNDIAPEQVLIDHNIKGPDKFCWCTSIENGVMIIGVLEVIAAIL
jgi:hypothetical protein